MSLDAWGHVFYASLAIGMMLLARSHNPWGWAFRLFGEVGWLVLGLALGFSSIVVWGVVFITVDCIGIYNAIQKKRKQND
tara:strand:- start:1467 stop:1706 length:240 start_codon:yes stop_codon:yes gene_type:complete